MQKKWFTGSPEKWVKLADLSAARKPDHWDDYQNTIDRKHNKGRDRDRVGRFRDRPREDERADNRDEQNEADGDERDEDVDRA